MSEELGAVVFIGWMALAVGSVWAGRRLVAFVRAWWVESDRVLDETWMAFGPGRCRSARHSSPVSEPTFGWCPTCHGPMNFADDLTADLQVGWRHMTNVEVAECERIERAGR